MNSTIVYHSADPESLQTSYTEYNNVDFVLNVGEGRSLVQNSVRILGDLLITSDGNTRVISPGGIFWDFKIGAHAFIESCQVSFGGGAEPGIKENIQNYSRWVGMTSVATANEDDMLNASKQVELKAPNELAADLLARGVITNNSGAKITDDIDFAFKPLCILNRMAGDHLPQERSGEIRLTLNLARNIGALMGPSSDANSTYQLKNLRCSYQSIATVGNPNDAAISMRSVYNVKSSIQSGFANVQAQVPAICDACSVSFQRQQDENVAIVNNYSLEKVPGIRDLQFLFNDSTNKYITYQINDQNEMLHRYIDSFTNTGHNQAQLDTFRGNGGWGVGLHFQGFTDLSQQRFSMQLTSDITNNAAYNVYMYFHSLVQA
jgi:hypothetical protein